MDSPIVVEFVSNGVKSETLKFIVRDSQSKIVLLVLPLRI